MDDSPLNGVTEMTFGSDTKGMLLESPPSKHHCRGKQFKYLYAAILIQLRKGNGKLILCIPNHQIKSANTVAIGFHHTNISGYNNRKKAM